jgi:hypothetical protein
MPRRPDWRRHLQRDRASEEEAAGRSWRAALPYRWRREHLRRTARISLVVGVVLDEHQPTRRDARAAPQAHEDCLMGRIWAVPLRNGPIDQTPEFLWLSRVTWVFRLEIADRRLS